MLIPLHIYYPLGGLYSDVGKNASTSTVTLAAVQKELADKWRRSSKVIVHGLAREANKSDDELFANFMESN